jgi:hypothetical protein
LGEKVAEGRMRGKRFSSIIRIQNFYKAFFLLVVAVSGCTTVKVSEREQNAEVAALTQKLRDLSPSVNTVEAFRAADTAVRYPLLLAEEWRVTAPAVFNNTLINVGIHPRGLCYEWADALTVKMMTLHLQTLEIHRGVAKRGTRREHSCVMLTATGQNFTNGIALDAWRDGGKLHWSPVLQDKYTWQEVELIPSYQAELKAAAEK